MSGRTLADARVVAVAMLVSAVASGCGWWGSGGFLSDYSRLVPETHGPNRIQGEALRYYAPDFNAYSHFIIEPVEVKFYGSKRRVKTSEIVLRDLTNYANSAVVEAFVPRYAMAAVPGPQIARLRVAITNLDESSPALEDAPLKTLVGLSLSGATLEFEAVDSQTKEQIAAIVLPLEGGRFDLSNLNNWPEAKAVVDTWARGLRKRVDMARGVADAPGNVGNRVARRGQ